MAETEFMRAWAWIGGSASRRALIRFVYARSPVTLGEGRARVDEQDASGELVGVVVAVANASRTSPRPSDSRRLLRTQDTSSPATSTRRA